LNTGACVSGDIEMLLVVVFFELDGFLKLYTASLALVLFDVVLFETVPDQVILANEGRVALVTLLVKFPTMKFHVYLQSRWYFETTMTYQAFKRPLLTTMRFFVVVQCSFGCITLTAKFTTYLSGWEMCKHMPCQSVLRLGFCSTHNALQVRRLVRQRMRSQSAAIPETLPANFAQKTALVLLDMQAKRSRRVQPFFTHVAAPKILMRDRYVVSKAILVAKDVVTLGACAHPMHIFQVRTSLVGFEHQAAKVTSHHGRIVGKRMRKEFAA